MCVYNEEEKKEFLAGNFFPPRDSLEGKSKMRRGEKPPSLQVTPTKFRPTVLAEAIIKSVQTTKGFTSRPLTINWIVEQHILIQAWQEDRKKEIAEAMRKAGLKPGDF